MTPKQKGGRHAVRSRSRKRQQSGMVPPSAPEGNGAVAPADQPPASVEDNRPVHVVLDNAVPGGFRMEPV